MLDTMKEMVYTANQFGELFSLEQYKEFMYCKDNEGNCRHCPENKGMQGSKPCGQQNCWVSCHCSAMDKAMVEEERIDKEWA